MVLNNDNDESRELIDSCYKMRKTVLNPIISWTDEEVWEFIKTYNIPYCKLYDEGYKRLGCIGCPMSSKRAQELENYPVYKRNYIKAFDRMLQNMDTEATTWKTGEDVYKWWIGDKT